MKLILGLLVLFGTADAVLTNLLVESGVAYEANPFLQSLAGTPGLVLIKVIGTALGALILWDIYHFSPRLGRITAGVFAAVYGFITCWNGGLLWLG